VRRAAAGIAAVVLVACSGSGARPQPSRTEIPSVSTSPSLSADPNAVHEFLGEAPLEPGLTRYSLFEPPFTFLVPEGWEGGHAHADYFDVWNGADLVVGFGRPSSVPGPDGRIEVDALAPRDALRAMSELVDEPGPISETEIDGRPAVEMSFSVDRRAGVLRFDAGVLHVEPPWRQRAIAFDVDGVLLVFLLQTMRPDGALDSPVLSSVEFEA
jgi:hypothetical protein